MVGHNNQIGRHNILCGQVGIAGSCRTGDYVVMAGQAGIKLLHVPYKGSAPALNDVLAGHVPLMFDLQATALPHIQGGKLKPLAVTGTQRSSLLPNVPTMIEAGVHLGLPRSTATELVVQTVVGSAKLLRETGEHPTVLREQVTSPGGTTAAAIRELESHKVRAAFMTAMEAARNRSRELAGES